MSLPPATKVMEPPTHCPACETKVVIDGAYITCPNRERCKPQIIGRIAKWVAKLNILEIGDGLIEKLVESKLAMTPADLYKLTVEQLSNVERMGRRAPRTSILRCGSATRFRSICSWAGSRSTTWAALRLGC